MLWAMGLGVTSTHDVTGRQLPLVTAPVEELGDDWLHICLDLLWQPRKAGKNMGMLKVWPIVGGVGNGAAEEDWCWDWNPGMASMLDGWDHVTLGCSLLPCGLGSRRDLAGKERGESTLADGPRDSATWFWINWRSWRQHSWWCQEPRDYLSHELLLLFLRYGALDWAEGEGRTVWICGYSKGL